MRVVQHLPDGRAEQRAGGAERDVADELLPHEPVDVVVGAHGEPGAAPHVGDLLDARVTGPTALRGGRARARDGGRDRGRRPRRRTPRRPRVPRGRRRARPPPHLRTRRRSGSGAPPSRGRAAPRHSLAAPRTSIAFVAITTRSTVPTSDGSDVAWTRTRRSPLAPSTRSPRSRIASTCSSHGSTRPHLVAGAAEQPRVHRAHRARADDRDPHGRGPRGWSVDAYFSGFEPAIQMITRLNFPRSSNVKKLQLCMSFSVPSRSSPM